ncbi:MAG: hypothetical protein WA899_04825, partial [Candidatus Sulfotelmatobacter sp.]
MPVTLVVTCEGPLYRFPAQPILDVGIVGYVSTIVVVKERVTINWVVERQRSSKEEETENSGLSSQGMEPIGSGRRGWNSYPFMKSGIHTPRTNRGFHNSLL